MNNIPTGFLCFPPIHWPPGWKLAYEKLVKPVMLVSALRGRLHTAIRFDPSSPQFWLNDLLLYRRLLGDELEKQIEILTVLDSVGAYQTLDVVYQIRSAAQPVLVASSGAHSIPVEASEEQTRQVVAFRPRLLEICNEFPDRTLLENLRRGAQAEIGIKLEVAMLPQGLGIVVPGSVVESPPEPDDFFDEEIEQPGGQPSEATTEVLAPAPSVQAAANPLESSSRPGNDVGDRPPANSGKKARKSTQRGDAETKLIAALLKYHQYADRGVLNHDPIVSNELARLAEVSQSSASRFFDKYFLPKGERGSGHAVYSAACRRNFSGKVLPKLMFLNGEYPIDDTYGTTPPGEQERHDD